MQSKPSKSNACNPCLESGLVIAGALLAFIPELGTLTRGGVAAIVGVAPYAQGSGRMRGRRGCQGGLKDIRDLLSTPAGRGKTKERWILYASITLSEKWCPLFGAMEDCGPAKNRYNIECNRREIKLCMPPRTLLLSRDRHP